MFFLKKLKYQKLIKKNYKIKKVFFNKKLKNLKKFNTFFLKKKVFKIKKISFLKNKKSYINYNLYIFFLKYFKFNNKKKNNFFFNNFYFLNIILKKNNIFFTITNLKQNIIYSNSLKQLKLLKKKKEILKKNTIFLFFIKSLKLFFKSLIFEKIFEILPNTYILTENQKSILLKKLLRVLIKFIYFFINLFGSSLEYRKYNKFLFSIKKAIKSLKYKRKIKILSVNIKYQNSFNGCRLKKLKRI